MSGQHRSIRGMLAVISLVVAWACAPASAPPSGKPITANRAAETATKQAPGSLAGQFLVATPRIEDPRFSRTVIFMVAHDDKGAMGLVINRAYGAGSLSQLLTGFGITDSRKAEGTVRLYYGGPVEPERGFVLHSPDYRGASTQLIDTHVALSTGRDVLEAIAAGHGPAETMFIIGYAGWSAGQLEREMAREDWLTAPGNPDLIFNDHPETTWGKAYREAGLTL